MSDTILIISPQRWDHIKISKHHFAITLANLGNLVYFLNPPNAEKGEHGIKAVEGLDNLFVVSYSSKIPHVIRFHFKWLFDFLLKYEVKRILRPISKPIDLVWCFDAHYYSDLKVFGAKKAILHVVDEIVVTRGREVAKTADLIIAVTKGILGGFDGLGPRQLLLNHGIGTDFVDLARKKYPTSRSQQNAQVGYAGNLMHSTMNRHALFAMITKYKNATFHFWGSEMITPISDHDAEMPAEVFSRHLRSAPNVTLHGIVEPKDLAAVYQSMDISLICYRNTKSFPCDNAHKILEYLASGSVVVSSPVSTYEDVPQCIAMAKSDSSDEIVELLGDVLSDLGKWNAPLVADQRKRIALENTCESHIETVFDCLYKHPSNS